jgi:hypothetical protein
VCGLAVDHPAEAAELEGEGEVEAGGLKEDNGNIGRARDVPSEVATMFRVVNRDTTQLSMEAAVSENVATYGCSRVVRLLLRDTLIYMGIASARLVTKDSARRRRS